MCCNDKEALQGEMQALQTEMQTAADIHATTTAFLENRLDETVTALKNSIDREIEIQTCVSCVSCVSCVYYAML